MQSRAGSAQRWLPHALRRVLDLRPAARGAQEQSVAIRSNQEQSGSARSTQKLLDLELAADVVHGR